MDLVLKMKRYLIWSEERGRWWRPGRRGYTYYIQEAGRYSEQEANEIVTEANKYPAQGFDWCEVALEDPFGVRQ